MPHIVCCVVWDRGSVAVTGLQSCWLHVWSPLPVEQETRAGRPDYWHQDWPCPLRQAAGGHGGQLTKADHHCSVAWYVTGRMLCIIYCVLVRQSSLIRGVVTCAMLHWEFPVVVSWQMSLCLWQLNTFQLLSPMGHLFLPHIPLPSMPAPLVRVDVLMQWLVLALCAVDCRYIDP